MASLDSSALCTSCGLCCDGTLFSRIELAPGEDGAGLETAGMRLVEANGVRKASQPCAALKGCNCTAYSIRPAVCRDYRCNLLRRLDAGETDVESALEIVASARRLRAEAMEQFARACPLPEGLSMKEYAHLAGADAMKTAQARRDNQAMLVACTLFQFHISRHFQKYSLEADPET